MKVMLKPNHCSYVNLEYLTTSVLGSHNHVSADLIHVRWSRPFRNVWPIQINLLSFSWCACMHPRKGMSFVSNFSASSVSRSSAGLVHGHLEDAMLLFTRSGLPLFSLLYYRNRIRIVHAFTYAGIRVIVEWVYRPFLVYKKMGTWKLWTPVPSCQWRRLLQKWKHCRIMLLVVRYVYIQLSCW